MARWSLGAPHHGSALGPAAWGSGPARMVNGTATFPAVTFWLSVVLVIICCIRKTHTLHFTEGIEVYDEEGSKSMTPPLTAESFCLLILII